MWPLSDRSISRRPLFGVVFLVRPQHATFTFEPTEINHQSSPVILRFHWHILPPSLSNRQRNHATNETTPPTKPPATPRRDTVVYPAIAQHAITCLPTPTLPDTQPGIRKRNTPITNETPANNKHESASGRSIPRKYVCAEPTRYHYTRLIIYLMWGRLCIQCWNALLPCFPILCLKQQKQIQSLKVNSNSNPSRVCLSSHHRVRSRSKVNSQYVTIIGTIRPKEISATTPTSKEKENKLLRTQTNNTTMSVTESTNPNPSRGLSGH